MKPTQANVDMIGYCTNVHAGVTLDQVKQNLQRDTLAVKAKVSPSRPMGVGLWLSKTATQDLLHAGESEKLFQWLDQRQLVPYTINAFPAGDFHQPVVKQAVYQPTWAERDRLDYTVDVATIHSQLLPQGSSGTISTLPLGWSENKNAVRGVPAGIQAAQTAQDSTEMKSSAEQIDFAQSCAAQLRQLTTHLETIEQTRGVHLRVCIEPEPGCVLDICDDVVDFFERHLRVKGDAAANARIDRYLGVCHDVCHSAVMFEPQSVALDRYAAAGIVVGKVQVSSAIEVDFGLLDDQASAEVLAQLSAFSEPRYLHQTTIRERDADRRDADSFRFYEDLSLAIASVGDRQPAGVWRVHFHVPIHESSLGRVGSTQSHVLDCLSWFERNSQALTQVHFEVETYAWNVLPPALAPTSLADGIASELNWFRQRLLALAEANNTEANG